MTIPNGGVIPNIHNIFPPNNKSNTSKAVVDVPKEQEDWNDNSIASIAMFASINLLVFIENFIILYLCGLE